MDYVLRLNAQFEARNTTYEDLYITTNQDALNTSAGAYYHWGLHGVVVAGLECKLNQCL